MMRTLSGTILVMLLLLFALPAVAAGSAGPDAATVTVGDLSVKLAGMLTGKHYDADGARSVLDQLGVTLVGTADAPVDQAYLIDALQQAGVRIRTTNPSAAVTAEQLDIVAALFQMENGHQDPCPAGFPGQSCNAVQCKGSDNAGDFCYTDENCPGGYCNFPPGLAKMVATPD